MSWKLLAQHAWQTPLAFAARLRAEKDWALLYSGRAEVWSGRYSYLFVEPAYHATGSHWRDLPPVAQNTGELPDWVGYLGYGMRTDDGFARNADAPITLPDFYLTRYARLLRFDHEAETIDEYGRFDAIAPRAFAAPSQGNTDHAIAKLSSNMTRTRYTDAVRATVAAIEAGDFYQANITRKFFGSFAAMPDSFSLFERLCAASPAPYSAYINHGGTAILSSSPECFLTIAGDGTITSRPIKGSSRRGVNAEEDVILREALRASEKNLAENLMIVDLMRHDLAQVSAVGSVRVAEQSALYSYATIHHLVSTVQAVKQPGKHAYDVVRACFPPGSMTGAPKRAAMQWCSAQEGMERGVYSGAIGWFGADDRCDLSVVIRTLVIDGQQFEFQVGGGIVAESTPEDEWRETLVKARGIAQALGISEAELEAL